MNVTGRPSRLLGLRRTGAAGHWWLQRLSSIALAPLSVWCVVMLLSHDLSYHTARTLLSDPMAATLALLFMLCGLYHSWLGVTVIMDDYLHAAVVKRAVWRSLQWVHVLLAVVSISAIFSIVGGHN
jgi:succinate dehydrogenase / fumarate reductase membrane anchor subunit